jgi:anti-anti-sigma factor
MVLYAERGRHLHRAVPSLAPGVAAHFTLGSHVAGDQAVVRVAGEIDLATAPQLEAHVSSLIDAGARRLTIDLADTTFVDSNGIGVFLEAHKRLGCCDGALTLRSPRRNIRKMLQITGLDQLVTVA